MPDILPIIEQRATSNEQRATSNEQRATSNEQYSYPLISAIVPVYNTEKYLDQCVQSIVNQTYKNLEVILVDDGSTDTSPAKCDEWARKDHRVRVLHIANSGAGVARNAGLEVAHGELVGTVDSDDFIVPEMYEKLYSLMRTHDADISMCEFEAVAEDGNIIPSTTSRMLPEVLTNEQAINRLLEFGHHQFLWNKLYKSEIFKDIRFPPGNKHDDTATLHRILWASRRTAVTDEALYMYRQRTNSVMWTVIHSKFNLKRVQDMAYTWDDWHKFFLELERPDWARRALKLYLSNIRGTLNKINYLQYRKELSPIAREAVKKLLCSGVFTDKLRAVKFSLIWLRSIFRPFIDKEKDQ